MHELGGLMNLYSIPGVTPVHQPAMAQSLSLPTGKEIFMLANHDRENCRNM